MKRIGKRLTLVLLLLLSFVLMIGGATALLLSARAESDPAAEPVVKTYGGDSTFYKLEYNQTEKQVTLLLDAGLWDYLDASGSDFNELINGLSEAAKDIVVNGILNAGSEAQPVAVATIASLPGDLPFDPDNVDLGAIEDYVKEHLYDEEALGDFLDGKYDMLFQFAVEKYVDEHGQDAYTDVMEKFDKLLGDAIDEVYKDSESVDRDTLKENFRDKAQELVDVVEQNDGKMPVPAPGELLGLLTDVKANGTVIFEDGQIVAAGLKTLLTDLPRPMELAHYTDDQFKSLLDYDVDVTTSYGDFSFSLTVGFDGDCSTLRTGFKYLAQTVDISTEGSTKVITIKTPEIFTKALLTFAETDRLTEAQKNAVFSLFGKTTGEIFDYADQNNADTFRQILDLLKSVDYQNWFSNLINADYIKSYVGKYLSDGQADSITDEKIDEFLDKLCDFAVPKLNNFTYESVENFLTTKFPKLDEVPEKLESAIKTLVRFLNKVDWEKFNAAYIRDLLANKSDFNDVIYDYIDKAGDHQELYDTFMSYAEKLFNKLPERIKEGTFLDLYKGDGLLSYREYEKLNSLIDGLQNFLERRHFDQAADYIDALMMYLDDTDYALDFRFEFQLKDVYKVSYSVEGKVVREGLLPVGADVTLFDNLEQVQNYDVLYWVDENGDEVETMPAGDLTVYPATDFAVTLDPDSIAAAYDPDTTYTVLPTVEGVDYAEYTYVWYKDGELYEGTVADDQSIALNTVADSGEYTLVVTDTFTKHSVTSEPLVVDIAKQTVNLEYSWAETKTLVYTSEAQTFTGDVVVTLGADKTAPEAVDSVVTVTKGGDWTKTDVGTYTATITVALVDEANYELAEGSEASAEMEWKISAATVTVDTSKIKLVKSVFTFGETVQLTLDETALNTAVTVTGGNANVNKKTLVSAALSGADLGKTAVGNYKVTVTFTLTDKNYAFSGGSATVTAQLDWSIVAKTIDLSKCEWQATDGLTVTYDGKDHYASVSIKNLPAEYTSLVRIYWTNSKNERVTKAIDAGVYKVNVEATSGTGYTVTGLNPATFTINAAVVKVSELNLEWDYSGAIEYDGKDHTVTLLTELPEYLKVDYQDNVKSAVGKYTAVATFQSTDLNYVLDAEDNTATLDWEIKSNEVVNPEPETVYQNEGDGVYIFDEDGTFDFDNETHADSVSDYKDYEKRVKDFLKDSDNEDLKGKVGTVGKAFDIHFTDPDGNEVHNPGRLLIRLRIPTDLLGEDRTLAVVHFLDDGNVEIMESERVTYNGAECMQFYADDFSVYAIVELTDETAANLWWLWLLIAIIVVLLIITVVLLVLLLKKKNEPEETAEETEEAVAADEPAQEEEQTVVVEDSVEEVVQEEEPAPSTGFVLVPTIPVPTDGTYYVYDKSFTARLSQAHEIVKMFYSTLKNELLSYKGVKSRISWGYDSFNRGRTKCVKLQIKGKTLVMYIALDPETLNVNKYHHKNVSDLAKYQELPTKLKIKSPRSLKYAKELIEILMSTLGAVRVETEQVNYDVPYQSTEALLQVGLIKIKQAPLPDFWAAPAAKEDDGEVAAADSEESGNDAQPDDDAN